MKNINKSLCKITAVALISSAVLLTGGCANSGESSTPETTAPSVTQETTVPQEDEGEFDIKSLQYYNTESTSPFAGAWKITDGVGSTYSSFVYIFDGNGRASLVVGNMGYCGSYSLTANEEIEEQELFVCHLMFGINGEYTYEFSDSKDTLVLTYKDSNDTSTLERLTDYTFMPVPDENPVTDEALVGAWASDNGIYYYFGPDGIMYANSYETMFTYYKYSAENGKVTAVYDMNGELTETFEYSFDGDTLTFDGIEYKRIAVSDLR